MGLYYAEILEGIERGDHKIESVAANKGRCSVSVDRKSDDKVQIVLSDDFDGEELLHVTVDRVGRLPEGVLPRISAGLTEELISWLELTAFVARQRADG